MTTRSDSVLVTLEVVGLALLAVAVLCVSMIGGIAAFGLACLLLAVRLEGASWRELGNLVAKQARKLPRPRRRRRPPILRLALAKWVEKQ